MLLTEQEIDEIFKTHHDEYGYPFTKSGYEQALEAKLLEKLKAQKPFSYFSINDYGAWEETSDPTAQALYERPLPPADVVCDAERYRWLRERNWSDSPLCVVTKPYEAVKIGHYCPSHDRLDAAIDAAMKEMK